MTQIQQGCSIVHSQFGSGLITRVAQGFIFAMFEDDTTEKIIKPQFVTEIGGVKTFFRNPSSEKTKGIPTQKDRIFDLLRDAGYAVGVNSKDLLLITHRFSAVIFTLRREGHDIKSKSNRDGSTTFTLMPKTGGL